MNCTGPPVRRIASALRCIVKTVLPFQSKDHPTMSALFTLIGWLILFVLCWPLALLALVLWPLVWLLSLPLRLIGITVGAVFALLKAVLFLPARVLGFKG
jgi:hypothetical protein